MVEDRWIALRDGQEWPVVDQTDGNKSSSERENGVCLI
jgi:hypothetical protein